MSDEERLKEIFLDYMEVEESDYDPEMTPEALSLDSLDLLQIVMDIEDEYGVDLNEDELSKATTMGQLLGEISAEINKRR